MVLKQSSSTKTSPMISEKNCKCSNRWSIYFCVNWWYAFFECVDAHDKSSQSSESLARISVLQDCKTGKIRPEKWSDEKGDLLYVKSIGASFSVFEQN